MLTLCRAGVIVFNTGKEGRLLAPDASAYSLEFRPGCLSEDDVVSTLDLVWRRKV